MMKQEDRMTYSYSKLRECVELVKGINVTVRRKNEHFAKANELTKVYEKCFENTQCVLFEPDWASYLEDYRKASYNYKNFTGKELTHMEERAIRYLQNQLNDLYRLMQTGEVNSIA